MDNLRKQVDMPNPTCTISGCEKPARSAKADWCKMHYHRWYRHGSTDKVTRTDTAPGPERRYKMRYMPSHPMATACGKAYEHRIVLFDAIGYGTHACHWCGTGVEWAPKGHPHELQPDHLNSIGDDNRLENLVPSCRRCNTTRALQAKSDRLRDLGWWSHNDTVGKLAAGRAARISPAA